MTSRGRSSTKRRPPWNCSTTYSWNCAKRLSASRTRGVLGVVGDVRGVREPELHVDGERLHVDLEVALGAVPRPTEPGDLSHEQHLVVGAIEILAKGGLHDEARRLARRRAVGGELLGQRRIDVGLEPDSLVSHDAPFRLSEGLAGPRGDRTFVPRARRVALGPLGGGCGGTSVDRAAHAKCCVKSTCGDAIARGAPRRSAGISRRRRGLSRSIRSPNSAVVAARAGVRESKTQLAVGAVRPARAPRRERVKCCVLFARGDVFETARGAVALHRQGPAERHVDDAANVAPRDGSSFHLVLRGVAVDVACAAAFVIVTVNRRRRRTSSVASARANTARGMFVNDQ